MRKRNRYLVLQSLILAGLLIFGSGPVFASGNSNQGKAPLEKARQVLEERLIGLPGIAGIAHMEETGEIIVFLENEHAKGQVPARFENFPVRTKITGAFLARSVGVAEPVAPGQLSTISSERLNAVSPLVGGVSVSAYVTGQSWAGTLGMVTYDNKLLSNTHVLALDLANNFLPAGTPIIQPGSYDGGTLAHSVGTLQSYIPIKFTGRTPNYADAAIANLAADVDASPGTQFSESGDYQVLGTTTVTAGDTVRKSGRTSGVTQNTVYLTNASVTVDYGGGKRAYFVDQIIIYQPFSQSGDSGSLVDKGSKFVGLVFAGSDSYSIVCKASYIIEGLGIAVEPTIPKTLESITITPKTASIAVDSTQQFIATGTYSDDSTSDLTAEVSWTSSDTGVATIIDSGLATGVSVGSATITASLGSLFDTAEFTVTEAPPQPTVEVSINMSSASRAAGKNLFVWAIATVNVGVDGATVEGHWDGATTGTVSGTTDTSGNVSLQSGSLKNPPSGITFTFFIDKVSKDGIIYILTGDSLGSITIP